MPVFTATTPINRSRHSLTAIYTIDRDHSGDKVCFTDSAKNLNIQILNKFFSDPKNQHVTRRPLPERELEIVRALITTSVSTNAIGITSTNKMTCPKCGSFAKSGRASCCAPGGAWYKNCGGVGSGDVEHSWSEGVEACKCKFESNGVC